MKRICPILLSCLLAACLGGEHEDVKQWMKENTKDLRGAIAPLPKVVPYQPVPYLNDKSLDPFALAKLEPDNKMGKGTSGRNAPDFEARNERNNLLEKFPLETIRMIGFLNVNHLPMAVVQVEQHIKQVRKGEYIGQDFGFVTDITDHQLVLKELVQDSAGDWTERISTLQLQAKEEKKK